MKKLLTTSIFALSISLGVPAFLSATAVMKEPSKELNPTTKVSSGEKLNPETVVATIDGIKITLGDILRLYQALPEHFRQLPFEQLYNVLLSQFIDMKILEMAAEKSDLKKDKDVQKTIETATKQILTQAFIENNIKGKINEKEVLKQYNELKDKIKKEKKKEVQVLMIVTKNENDAKNIIASLDKTPNMDFQKLAREKSIDDETKAAGGDIGFVVKEMLDPAAGAAVFNLQDGTYTKEAVKGQGPDGKEVYRIFKRVKTRDVSVPPLKEIAALLRNKIIADETQKLVKNLKKDHKIVENDMSGKEITPKTNS